MKRAEISVRGKAGLSRGRLPEAEAVNQRGEDHHFDRHRPGNGLVVLPACLDQIIERENRQHVNGHQQI